MPISSQSYQTATPKPPAPGGGPPNGPFGAKLRGPGERGPGGRRAGLRCEREQPPFAIFARHRAHASPGFDTCAAPFLEYRQHSKLPSWQRRHRRSSKSCSPSSVSMIRPIWPADRLLLLGRAANSSSDTDHHFPSTTGRRNAVSLP
ncbi:hypothetical protein, variant 2 [Verruconis gallopava]|uniref:Uncharacterized protein n=1 Tax=Verruconis gallopava TaxID=253628 RepID=A0A0D2AH67_9PEZI|nr:uncharacterized protein PV09_09870 [Verruconis gallopava]XP_016208153.1 hypothetical protein, variant 1 [Verruconis gallopava]XP_016208154.1 hypothetical protein, variant 2 [Verruconis gallopava]KIV98282.1 hypothetical protein PV09_09870 [Verruconis gallopava]KIV98283.1 hypothetical protein, variant 1 [Verruconis gallopava]KIV98284.1 hypothetical protein, variant 2 [Verruconis gallopava]